MSLTFVIHYCDDLYEIALDGYLIHRITKYFYGTSQRQEMEYDECPNEVKDLIFAHIVKQLAYAKKD